MKPYILWLLGCTWFGNSLKMKCKWLCTYDNCALIEV